jgi:hypothetical protein
MIPHFVHTMRGPNVGTGVSSGHRSTLRMARWWHCQHDTASDRTPLSRMLPSVIGSIGSLERERAIGAFQERKTPSPGRLLDPWEDGVTAGPGAPGGANTDPAQSS